MKKKNVLQMKTHTSVNTEVFSLCTCKKILDSTVRIPEYSIKYKKEISAYVYTICTD